MSGRYFSQGIFKNEMSNLKTGLLRRMSSSLNHEDKTLRNCIWDESWSKIHKNLSPEKRDEIYEWLYGNCKPKPLEACLLGLNMEGKGLYCNDLLGGPFIALGTTSHYKFTSEMDGNFCTAQEFYLLKDMLVFNLGVLIKNKMIPTVETIDQFRKTDNSTLVDLINKNETRVSVLIFKILVEVLATFIPGVSVITTVLDVMELTKIFLDISVSSSSGDKDIMDMISENTKTRSLKTDSLKILDDMETLDDAGPSSILVEDSGSISVTEKLKKIKSSIKTLSDYKGVKEGNIISIKNGLGFSIKTCHIDIDVEIKKLPLNRYDLTISIGNNHLQGHRVKLSHVLNISINRVFRIIFSLLLIKFHKTMGVTDVLSTRVNGRDSTFPRYEYNMANKSFSEVTDVLNDNKDFDSHLYSISDCVEKISSEKNNKFITIIEHEPRNVFYYGFIDQMKAYFKDDVEIAREIFNKAGVTDEKEILKVIGRSFNIHCLDRNLGNWKMKRFNNDINYLLICNGFPKAQRMSNRIPVSLYVMKALEEKGACKNPFVGDSKDLENITSKKEETVNPKFKGISGEMKMGKRISILKKYLKAPLKSKNKKICESPEKAKEEIERLQFLLSEEKRQSREGGKHSDKMRSKIKFPKCFESKRFDFQAPSLKNSEEFKINFLGGVLEDVVIDEDRKEILEKSFKVLEMVDSLIYVYRAPELIRNVKDSEWRESFLSVGYKESEGSDRRRIDNSIKSLKLKTSTWIKSLAEKVVIPDNVKSEFLDTFSRDLIKNVTQDLRQEITDSDASNLKLMKNSLKRGVFKFSLGVKCWEQKFRSFDFFDALRNCKFEDFSTVDKFLKERKNGLPQSRFSEKIKKSSKKKTTVKSLGGAYKVKALCKKITSKVLKLTKCKRIRLREFESLDDSDENGEAFEYEIINDEKVGNGRMKILKGMEFMKKTLSGALLPRECITINTKGFSKLNKKEVKKVPNIKGWNENKAIGALSEIILKLRLREIKDFYLLIKAYFHEVENINVRLLNPTEVFDYLNPVYKRVGAEVEFIIKAFLIAGEKKRKIEDPTPNRQNWGEDEIDLGEINNLLYDCDDLSNLLRETVEDIIKEIEEVKLFIRRRNGEHRFE